MKRILILMTIFSCFTTCSFAAMPESLVYMTEEYAPYNYTEDGVLKGISVELLKLIWQEMGVMEQEVVILPWARAYYLIQKKQNHVLFAMSRTKARENLFKWVGPMYDTKRILIGLAKRDYEIKSLEDVKKYQVGTIREDGAEQFLKKNGVESFESVSDISKNFKKLQAGRIDLIAYSERGVTGYIELAKLKANHFKKVYVLSETKGYYAFNKNTPDRIIQLFQESLDKLRKSGQLEKVLYKYFSR